MNALTIVGVGPGAPDLITMRAYKMIQQAQNIAYFCGRHKTGQAISVVDPYLSKESHIIPLIYPYTTELPANSDDYKKAMRAFYDESARRLAHHLNAHERTILLCEGDPLLYGSAMYIIDRLKDSYSIEIVPGIMSMNGSWCQAQLPMVHGHDCLIICSATMAREKLITLLRKGDGLVIMKLGKNFLKVKEALEVTGRYMDATYVERGTQKDGKIKKLKDVIGKVPYFSLILVPGRQCARL